MISQILDKLYVGDVNFSDEELEARHIWHILNVSGVELQTKRRLTHIHLTDDGHNSATDFSTILSVLEDEMMHGWSTLVCCRAGMSRSVFICILWLEKMGMSREEAYAYVKSKHPVAQVNPDLWRSM